MCKKRGYQIITIGLLFYLYRYENSESAAAETPSSVAQQPESDSYGKLTSDRDIISMNIKQLIDEVNSKRKRDNSLVSGKQFQTTDTLWDFGPCKEIALFLKYCLVLLL